MTNKNQQAFFALVRAGLWEKEARLSVFDAIDFNEVYRIAEEQAVVGLGFRRYVRLIVSIQALFRLF